MSEYMSVRQASRQWNLTERRVTALCVAGRLEGAIKTGKSWRIPADAQMPADKRITSGVYRKENRDGIKPMPVGISSYRQAVQHYHMVDKTLLIRDLLMERSLVTVFIQPRKFGKTLNLDMLKTYLEAGDENVSAYFRNQKIWNCGSAIREHMGKYPVVFLSFRIWGCHTWEQTLEALKKEIQREMKRHLPILNEELCGENDWKAYQSLCSGEAAEAEYLAAGKLLCKLLTRASGEKTVFLLDDYDAPLQNGDQQEAREFLQAFLGSAFQDNADLAFACVTGTLPIYGMSLFSGLEDGAISSVTGQKYSQYFGFTQEELEELATYYGKADSLELCRSWYGGFYRGAEEIYNPWSVASFLQNACVPRLYWSNPLGSLPVSEWTDAEKEKLYAPLQTLLKGGTVLSMIKPHTAFAGQRLTAADVFCRMLLFGFLTAKRIEEIGLGACMAELTVPNREAKQILRSVVIQMLEPILPEELSVSFREALFTKQYAAMQAGIRAIITNAAAKSDEPIEAFYDSLCLLFCALLGEQYSVEGIHDTNGRESLRMLPQNAEYPGIVLEMKAERSCTATELKRGAIQLYRMIGEKKIDAELKSQGVERVLSFGVGICGKNAEVATL